MKVIVKGNSAHDLQITFFITDEEEKAAFHDHAAISLCDGAHPFIAHCYNPKNKDCRTVTYDIPIKPAIRV